jgi:pre-mRNA-splicing factor RBM22/SLT11
MLDLSFGLPIVIRDAALKMVAPGPQSGINREFYAQNHEKEIEEGRGAIEAYEKTDEKARELLKRLANSEPYYKKQRRIEAAPEDEEENTEENQAPRRSAYGNGPGPIRTSDTRRGGSFNGRGGRGRGGGRGGRAFPPTAQLPPSAEDINPPADPKVTSLFVTGVEDDLPEHEVRTFFSEFGQLRSLVCSHRAHCAFVNYATRASAEAAAFHCQGKATIKGCPLRVRWGKPKPLDSMADEERKLNAREGRQLVPPSRPGPSGQRVIAASGETAEKPQYAVAPPPGSNEVQYASLSGE